jgi:DNA polymerase III epsilon subunit family exonuclease
MMDDLTRLPLDGVSLAFLDVETTGLRPSLGDRVVEVAVVRARGSVELARFASLVNPQRPLNPEATRVNGITPTMVADAPTFPDLLDQLLLLIEDAVLVCHNAPFDLSFLE